MINREELEQELTSERALKVIPNAQKCVIIPVRKGIKFPKKYPSEFIFLVATFKE